MRSIRFSGVAVGVSTLLVLAGCTAYSDPPLPASNETSGVARGDGSAASGQRPAEPRKFARILDGLQAERVYVMAGDDVLHAGLGAISRTGLAPWQTRPGLRLLSSVSGNGRTVIVGGVATGGDSYSDGVYLVQGDKLEEITPPGSEFFGPTVSSTGIQAAIRPFGGFFTRSDEDARWIHDPRSGSMTLSSIAWDEDSNAYAIVHPGRQQSRLVKFAASGEVERLAALRCATTLLSRPDGLAMATKLPARAKARCGRALVVRPQGAPTVLPRDWDPLTWSADGTALLLGRGREIGLWDVAAKRFVVRVTVEARIWMAAIVQQSEQ